MHVTPPDPQYAPEPPTSYLPGATPPTGGQPTPRRSIPLLLALLGGAGLVLVSCLGGVAVGSAGSATKQVVSFKPSPYPVVSTVTVTKTVEVKPAAPAAPPPPPAARRSSDGTWIVGEDFPAGTYKAANAGDNCYWAIYKPGANVGGGDGIEDNHIGGGSLRVTLQKGQGFTTNRCGTWAKVG
jgi:hypothetical protein